MVQPHKQQQKEIGLLAILLLLKLPEIKKTNKNNLKSDAMRQSQTLKSSPKKIHINLYHDLKSSINLPRHSKITQGFGKYS